MTESRIPPNSAPTQRARILVVDDEINARSALADLLCDGGYAVETASDGFKAPSKLQDFAPDLLLTDLRMPGMDGVELVCKASQVQPAPVAILMTAVGATERAASAKRAGAVECLAKPIDVDALMSAVVRVLGQ